MTVAWEARSTVFSCLFLGRCAAGEVIEKTAHAESTNETQGRNGEASENVLIERANPEENNKNALGNGLPQDGVGDRLPEAAAATLHLAVTRYGFGERVERVP